MAVTFILRSRRYLRGAALTLGVAALMAACAPGETSSGAHVKGTLQVSGDYDLQTSFDTPAPADIGGKTQPVSESTTCAQYAKGAGTPGTFEVPQVNASGDTTLYLTGGMTSGYAGPKTYTTTSNKGLTGEIVVSTPQGPGSAFTIYRSARGGTATLTVKPDGSGTLRFNEWGSTETRGTNIAGAVEGTLDWTCH